MTTKDGDIVPFGKYKKRPVTELLADRSYVDWLRSQPWLQQTQPNIYNIIVGAGGAEPQDTPEHNAMQARYLDEATRLQLANFYAPSREALQAEWRTGQSEWTDREVRVLSSSQPRFEVKGWDVVFDVFADLRQPNDDSPQLERLEHNFFAFLYIELKPAIADDFPTVLRQVVERRDRQCGNGPRPFHARWIVVTDRLDPSTVSATQVKEMFRSRGVRLLLSSDLANKEWAA